MKYSLVLLVLFYWGGAFAFEQLKSGDKDKCAKAESYMNSKSSTNLEQAYYLSKVTFCARKQQFSELTREEWFSSNYYLENIFKVNELASSANYNQEAIELISEMHEKFYLTAKTRETITKAFLEAVEKNPDYWSSDEHPYIRHELETNKYGLIAMSYYSAGMKEDGLRILNELRARPLQYIPEIDEMQKDFEVGYEKWVSLQRKKESERTGEVKLIEETGTKADQENYKLASNEIRKLVAEDSNQAENSRKLIQVGLFSIIEEYGKYILLVLLLIGVYLLIFIWKRSINKSDG